MTIEKGQSWGTPVARPDDLRVVDDDAALARALQGDGGRPTGLAGGDLFRTVGARPLGTRDELLALPLDLIRLRIDDAASMLAVAHVVARRPWWRGGWLRGPVLAVMNAEFLGAFDVAPRGHPNDGRAETLLGDASMTIRQRWAVRRRLPNASHLPHPLITTRSIRSHEWTFDERLRIIVDGVAVGSGWRLTIDVDADAAVLYA